MKGLKILFLFVAFATAIFLVSVSGNIPAYATEIPEGLSAKDRDAIQT